MCKCDLENTTLSNSPSIDNDTCLYQIDPDLENICCLLQQYLEVEGRLVVCVLGLVFNALVIILLLDRRLVNELFNRLLLCLVLIDNLYLLVVAADIWIYWLGRDEDLSLEQRYLSRVLYFFVVKPVRGMARLSRIYMTVTLALQRYISITKPLDIMMRDRQINKPTWTHTFKFTLPVLLFSIVYMIPEFFEFSIQRHNFEDIGNNTDLNHTVVLEKFVNDGFTNISTEIVVSDLRKSDTYVLAYITVGNFIITGLIPLILLAYFNFYIYQGMRLFMKRRSERRNGERDPEHSAEIRNQLNQTVILFAMVLIFILSNSLRISMNISDWINLNITKRELAKDCTYRLPYWYMISVPISQILMDLNSSVNFSIYCAFNNSFRSVINDHVGKIFEWCLPRNYCNQRSNDAEMTPK